VIAVLGRLRRRLALRGRRWRPDATLGQHLSGIVCQRLTYVPAMLIVSNWTTIHILGVEHGNIVLLV